MSRIWAGDELHSFVLSWFIAFNTTRQQRPKSFSQRFISTSVLGQKSAHSIFCAAFVPEVPWPGGPSAVPAAFPREVTPSP